MSRPKLLIADDSVTIRKVVELTFADEGVEVSAVGTAQDAMQKFVELQPDIVLVDAGLDGTNGYQICSMIKQDEQTKDIPVLLLVGSFEPFDQDEAEKAGADGFVTKPFHSIRNLVSRVTDLLNGNGGSSVQSPAVAPDDEDIESLYKSSFATTEEIERFDTVDDLSDHDGFDDEMIETLRPGQVEARTEEIPLTEATTEYELEMPSEKTEEEQAEEELVFVRENHSFSSAETQAFEPPPLHVVGRPFEESISEAPTIAASSDAFAELASESPDISEVDQGHNYPPVAEPDGTSPELVELIVQKVIERLSDRAVRDIAQEAVPRIAEKLIREALEEGKKD